MFQRVLNLFMLKVLLAFSPRYPIQLTTLLYQTMFSYLFFTITSVWAIFSRCFSRPAGNDTPTHQCPFLTTVQWTCGWLGEKGYSHVPKCIYLDFTLPGAKAHILDLSLPFVCTISCMSVFYNVRYCFIVVGRKRGIRRRGPGPK